MRTKILFSLFIFIKSALCFADDLSIIQVHRNIPLSDEEPTYRDLFLNGGENAGVKKNQIYTVFHRVQIKDFSGTQSYGEIEIPVGEAKIIAVYNKVAVARELKIYPREDQPNLDILGIMSGDRLELKK